MITLMYENKSNIRIDAFSKLQHDHGKYWLYSTRCYARVKVYNILYIYRYDMCLLRALANVIQSNRG